MTKQTPTAETQKANKPAPQPVTPTAQALEFAPLQEPLELLLQRAEREPPSVTPNDASRLQRTVGNQAVGQIAPTGAHSGTTNGRSTPTASLHAILTRATIQPKLTLGPVDDPYEQEADQVAQEVVQRLAAPAPPPDDDPTQSKTAVALQRQEEEEPLQLQTSGIVAPEGGTVAPDVETNIHSARGGGQPIADSARAPLENAFAADFSGVRVHTGGQADALNQSLSARAFTTGPDIFFRQGEYNPGSRAGQELLAHELTHVVQQGASQAQAPAQRQENDEELAQTKPIQRHEDDEEMAQAKRIQRHKEEAALQTKRIQRQEESEDDAPTPEQKAAALAAAEIAKARATTAKVKGESDEAASQAQATGEKAEGEAPKQEAAQSQAAGGVSDAKLQEQEQTKKQGKEAGQSQQETAQAAMQEKVQGVATGAPASVGPQAGAGPAVNGAGLVGMAAAPTGAGLEGATTAAQTAVQQAFTDAENPPDKAPDSPAQDPGYTQVMAGAAAVGQAEQTHADAQGEADEAQLAAESPPAELNSKAQTNQVGDMEAAETPAFDAAAFKQALLTRIAELAPKSAKEADEFKENDKVGGLKNEVKGTVAQEQEASQQPLDSARAAAPDTGSVEPKPTEPLTPTDPGAPPADIGAATAVPKPKGQGELEAPLQAGSQSLDQQMADADITDEQLANANEPEFAGALEAKEGAQQTASETPGAYRQEEAATLSSAEGAAVATAQASLQGMHGDRANLLTQADDQQAETKTADEQKRAEVAAHINTIYEETQTEVEDILAGLDGEVTAIFDAGAEEAKKAFEDYVDARMDAYKEERYGGFWGWAKWAKDQLLGMPDAVNVFYTEGRQLYIDKMDAVIDHIAATISTTLAEAKAAVARGKQRIQEYVDSLPEELQTVGQEAAEAIAGKFDELEQQINDKQSELVDTLAQKYQENLQAIDARIEELKAANRGLVDKALDAIGGVIKTIIELKNMLLNVLARVAEVIGNIIKDPIGFLGNLLSAIKQGFGQFVDNIGTHLQKGLISWLTGSIAEAGLTLPESFDLKGIFQLVMQILGVSFEQIIGKVSKVLGFDVMGMYDQIMQLVQIYQEEGLVGLAKYGLTKLIGQEGVDALMEVVKIFDVIKNGDFGQLWQIIQGHLSSLKEMVMGKIEEFIASRVIKAGITWLIGLFNPVGAFIKACKMIYDVVMFFIENGSKIMSLINAIIDSMAAIASGNISAAANFIEQTLAKAIPIAISFLSSLLGLGNISGKVKEIIESVRGAVNNAIDKILNSKPVQMVAGFIKKAIAKVKGFVSAGIDKAKGALGLGGTEAAQQGDGKVGDGEVGKTVAFGAAGGSHRLWYNVQGTNATMMVASEPGPLGAKINEWEQRLAKEPEQFGDQKQLAQSKLSIAKNMLGMTEAEGKEAAKEKQEAEQDPGNDHKEREFETADQEAEEAQENLADVLKLLFEIFGDEIEEIEPGRVKQSYTQAARSIAWGERQEAVQRMPLYIKDAGVMKMHTLAMTETLVAQVASDLGVPEKLPTGESNPDYSDLTNTIFRLHEENKSYNNLAELTAAVADALRVKRSVRTVDWDASNVQDIHPEREEFLDLFASFTSASNADTAWNLTINGIKQQRQQNLAGRKRDPNQYYADLANAIAPHLAGIAPFALWSGGIGTSLYARSLGYTTLESTQAGKVYDALKLFANFSTLGPLWNNLSRQFVRAMTGEVHVFMRVYNPASVLFRQELPELNPKVGASVSSIRWHVLREWSHAALKEVDAQGRPTSSYAFNSHQEAVQVMEASYIRDKNEQPVDDAGADAIKAELRKQLLTNLPYIGNARADAILAVYPTIEQLRGASLADLKDIPGIGAATAQKVYDLFH
ncbi:MAG: DUF4157 domain-containing protein [Anaerolinea sp.]|nr:DUF4157 domain-containing protein [Anaerolinea sp.]